ARVDLLPEFKGSSTYWLFHDNYLAAHLLERSRPELSQRIRSALVKFGFTNSGKIEIVFDEAAKPLPFRTYVLTNVAIVEGKTIRTELVTTNILVGWTEYADLLLLAAVAQARSSPADAQRNFEKAVAMWDGHGFHDAATSHSGLYATYKLALYLIAADRLHISPPHGDEVIKALLAMQSPDGGWKTDYKEGKPVGFANVETTCLALLALETLRKAPQPKSDGQIVKVSENGRYFVDQDGQPIFWLGTTQWQLLRDHSLDEARIIIEKSKGHGFVFAQVMIAGVGDGRKPNVNGDLPWINSDVRTPNEKYFKHVDQVIEIAREQN